MIFLPNSSRNWKMTTIITITFKSSALSFTHFHTLSGYISQTAEISITNILPSAWVTLHRLHLYCHYHISREECVASIDPLWIMATVIVREYSGSAVLRLPQKSSKNGLKRLHFTFLLYFLHFSQGKFRSLNPGKASCDSHATKPMVHAGCFSASIIHELWHGLQDL